MAQNGEPDILYDNNSFWRANDVDDTASMIIKSAQAPRNNASAMDRATCSAPYAPPLACAQRRMRLNTKETIKSARSSLLGKKLGAVFARRKARISTAIPLLRERVIDAIHPPDHCFSVRSASGGPPYRGQFTLRTVFIVIIAAAIVAGHCAKRAEDRASAIAMIEERGGEVFFDQRAAGLRRWITWLVTGGEQIARIDLWHAALTDTDFAKLSVLSEVERLDLVGSTLPRTWASHASRLKQLRRLELDGSSICDGDLAVLPGLPKLRTLSLTETRITDASITHVNRRRGLERVALDGGRISDRALDALRRMPNLAIVTVTTSAD